MSEEFKSTQIYYGENVLMMRVDDCLIFGNKDALRRLAEKLTELPSAEPERKRGHWIDTDNYYQRWKCSECGCHTRDAEPNFCPNCGADMTRGE